VVRLASTALIPVDRGEASLEWRIEVTEERRLAPPGTAVQEDQRWVSDALAADHHPLIESTQPTVCGLRDASGHDLAMWPAERGSLPNAPHVLAPDRRRPSKSLARDSDDEIGSNVPLRARNSIARLLPGVALNAASGSAKAEMARARRSPRSTRAPTRSSASSWPASYSSNRPARVPLVSGYLVAGASAPARSL
jgi:hypothetical protein